MTSPDKVSPAVASLSIAAADDAGSHSNTTLSTNHDSPKHIAAITGLHSAPESPSNMSTLQSGMGFGRRLRLLLIPLLALWWCLAFATAWLTTFMVLPSWCLAQRLYWACPFIPYIFRAMGPLRGSMIRVGFEASYCINVVTRFLTLPMRTELPNFYIVGFPKCGTTSLAERLKTHPAISSPAGLPYHEALSKETHFFEGVLGRGAASSPTLYRSFFPTVMKKWWAEGVRGVAKHMCFDACPVHACLPYVARRIAHITPDAKIIIMLRDPTAGVYSAEVMLSDMGVPLPWPSLAQPLQGPLDPRFKGADQEENRFWESVARLDVEDPLPEDLPRAFYMTLNGILRCGNYHQLLQPYLTHFPPENIMIINFNEFTQHTDVLVDDVLRFVGADPALLPRGREHRPAMQNAYKGRKMHPSVTAKLRNYYRPSILQLEAMLGRSMGWAGDVEAPTTTTDKNSK